MERLAREHEAGAVGIGQGVRDEAQEEGFVESVDLVADDGEAEREERGANLVGASRPRARENAADAVPGLDEFEPVSGRSQPRASRCAGKAPWTRTV